MEDDIKEGFQNDNNAQENISLKQKMLIFAAYLLKLETCERVPERTIDDIASNSTVQLINFYMTLQRHEIVTQLDLNACVVTGLASSNLTQSLGDLDTKHKPLAFCRRHCNLVEPKEGVLGERNKIVKGRLTSLKDLGYIIPHRPF